MSSQDETIKNLIELIKKPVKSINNDGPTTLIEFEDGEILPLFGGGAVLPEVQTPKCSFCGREQSPGFPLMGPPHKDDPLICSSCASKSVEIFIKNGVEIELDVSYFPEHFKNKLLGLTKDEA